MIRYEKNDHVGAVTVDAPCAGMNDLEELADELSDLRARLGVDDEVRVVVLSGFGRINWPMDLEMEGRTDCLEPVGGRGIRQPAAQIARIDCPVIAAIEGNALGPGLELALGCDLRVASEDSRFGLPHLQAGVIPWDGGTQRLPRLIGRAKTMEMILTGCTLDAKDALRIGLVNRVVACGALKEAVMKTAHEMSSKGPIALRYVKEAVQRGMALTLEQGLRLEADLYLLIHSSRDRVEGIEAFQEKRKPEFQGE